MERFLSFCKSEYCLYSILGLSLLVIGKGYFNGPLAKNKKDLTGKIVIVTGASDGIGVPTATELLKSGAKVIFACRNEHKTRDIILSIDKKYQENCFFMKLDLSSFESLKEFINEFKKQFNQLDILVNNAGAGFNDFGLTEDGIEQTFQVNTFSPMILTQELLGLLDKSKGRVINVSSNGHKRVPYSAELVKTTWNEEGWNYNKKNYKFFNQYCYSKLGNVFFNQYLNDYINKNKLNVKTVSLHPGVIHTELFRDIRDYRISLFLYIFYPIFWYVTKPKFYGAQTTLFCCYESFEELKSGEYYRDCFVNPVHFSAQYKETENRLVFIEWARNQINKFGKKSGIEFKI